MVREADRDVTLAAQIYAHGALVSEVTLTPCPDDTYEIGWTTEQDYRRRGFALRCAQEVLQRLTPRTVVWARIRRRHAASEGLAARLGFVVVRDLDGLVRRWEHRA